ncbi:unnamed protein product [Boreogadus saida]
MSCEEGVEVGRYFPKPHVYSNNNNNNKLSPHKVGLDTSHSQCCQPFCCDSSCQTRGREEQWAPGGPGEGRGRVELGGGGLGRLGEEQAPGGPGERRREETEGGAGDYLDLHSSCSSSCRPEEEEEEEGYSDWSEEDLSLHFSASIILPSDEESDRETGETQNKEKEGPQAKGGVDVSANQLLSQSKCHRPATFLRQHSMPAYYQRRFATSDEEGPRGYRGLVTAGRPELLGPGRNSKPRLQKSFSLDETKTKLASCIIKEVLSKKMQVERGPAKSASNLIPNHPNCQTPGNQPKFRHGVGGTSLVQGGPVHIVRDIKSQVQTTGRLSFTNSSSAATTTHHRATGWSHVTYKVIGAEDSPPPSYQQAVGVKDTKEATKSHPLTSQSHATVATALPQSQERLEGSRFPNCSTPIRKQAAANQTCQLGPITEGGGQRSGRVRGSIPQQGSAGESGTIGRPPLPVYSYTPTLGTGYARPTDLPDTPTVVSSSSTQQKARGGKDPPVHTDDYKGFISTSTQNTSTHKTSTQNPSTQNISNKYTSIQNTSTQNISNKYTSIQNTSNRKTSTQNTSPQNTSTQSISNHHATHKLDQTQLHHQQLHQHQLLQQQQFMFALQGFWPGGGLVGLTNAGPVSTMPPTQRQVKTLFDPETGQYVEVLLPLANYATGMISVGPSANMIPVGPSASMIPVGYGPIQYGSAHMQVGSAHSMIPVSSAPLHVGSAPSLIPVGCRVMSYHPMPVLASYYPPFTLHTHPGP